MSLSKSSVLLLVWLGMALPAIADRVDATGSSGRCHGGLANDVLGSMPQGAEIMEEAKVHDSMVTLGGGRARCSEVPVSDCTSSTGCSTTAFITGQYKRIWCAPTVCDAEAESSCEFPFCRLLEGKNGSECVHYTKSPLFGITEEDTKPPLWRPPLIDRNPAGFRFRKLPCGPGAAEVTKKYVLKHYKKTWDTFWLRHVLDRLYFNGHLMALNGCTQCSVFDTHDMTDQDYFVENQNNNELVITCLPSGCNSPNFFVRSTGWVNYCHPCPDECESCKKHTFWASFMCVLKTQSMPRGYECSMKAEKEHEPARATCKTRKFALEPIEWKFDLMPSPLEITEKRQSKKDNFPRRAGGPLSPGHNPAPDSKLNF